MLGDDSPFDILARNADTDEPTLGVLCIHGFTSTPFSMRYLAESLCDRGMRVRGILLPGHGTTPDELDQTTWRDWFDAVQAEFDILRAECPRVAVVGQSLGGLLSLHLAHRRRTEVTAVATLAAPLRLHRLPTLAVKATTPSTRPGRWLRRLVPRLPKLGGADTRDSRTRDLGFRYRVIPVRALHQVHAFMEMVRGEVHEIPVPTLIVHAKLDHTAPLDSARELHERLPHSRLRILEHSYHNISIDLERDIVAREVGRFLTDHLSAIAKEAGT